MIFRNRKSVAAPMSLTARNSAGKRELSRARTHYKTQAGSFEFVKYKGKDVVEQLQTLFQKKCAYCETKYGASGPMHVEHYRPKLRVVDNTPNHGYWWLANEWTNLLPSCHDCNCERWHDTVEDAPEFDGVARPAKYLYGKGNQFPLNGTPRARSPRHRYSNEDPLLIDPTRRDPREHITWKIIKDRSFAAPRWNAQTHSIDAYGLTSVRIYGLNRPDLMEARSELLGDIRLRANRLRKRVAIAASMTSDDLAETLVELIEEIGELSALARGDKAYSAAVDAEFSDFFKSSLATLEAKLLTL